MSERIVIKEICEVYDGPHATPKKTVDGPVYLGIDAITDDGKINAKEFAHLSEEDYIKWTKRVTPQYGDIVFSYEATLGRYALIPKDFYGCLGRRLAIIRNVSKDIDTLWVAMKAPAFLPSSSKIPLFRRNGNNLFKARL